MSTRQAFGESFHKMDLPIWILGGAFKAPPFLRWYRLCRKGRQFLHGVIYVDLTKNKLKISIRHTKKAIAKKPVYFNKSVEISC